MEDATIALTQFTCNKHSPGTRERVHMCMCQQGASACTHLCFGGSQLLCQLRGMTLGGTSQLVQHHLVLGNHIGQRVVHTLPTEQDSTNHTTAQHTTQGIGYHAPYTIRHAPYTQHHTPYPIRRESTKKRTPDTVHVKGNTQTKSTHKKSIVSHPRTALMARAPRGNMHRTAQACTQVHWEKA